MDGGLPINLLFRTCYLLSQGSEINFQIQLAVEKHRGRKSLGRTISTAN